MAVVTPRARLARGRAAATWERIVARLRAALAANRGICLMLDYDGTLTPIVARPIDAWLAAGVREDLRALTDSGRVTVAVVSGRSLADVRGRVGLPASSTPGVTVSRSTVRTCRTCTPRPPRTARSCGVSLASSSS